jgi:hypothetical protein
MNNNHNSFNLPKHDISVGSRGTGKTARIYSEMIASGNYPVEVNAFQQNEIKQLWQKGSTMQAINKLQSILEQPIVKKDKSLL